MLPLPQDHTVKHEATRALKDWIMKPGPVSRMTQNHSTPTILTTCVPVFSWHAQTNALNVMRKVYFQVRFHVSPAMRCEFKVIPHSLFLGKRKKKSMKIAPTRLFKMIPRVRPQGNTRNESVLFPCLYPCCLSVQHTCVGLLTFLRPSSQTVACYFCPWGSHSRHTMDSHMETILWAEGPKTDFVRMALMY